jgi:hypothetical protein
MLDRLHREVHVQAGPVEVIRRRQLHSNQLCYWSFAEPRELVERQEEFALSEEEP